MKWIVNMYVGDGDFVRSCAVFETEAEANNHAIKCRHIMMSHLTSGGWPPSQFEFNVEMLDDYP